MDVYRSLIAFYNKLFLKNAFWKKDSSMNEPFY